MRLAQPQPFELLDHTADVGVRVRGASAAEALGRLALALGALLAGEAAVDPTREERLRVEGTEPSAAAVMLLRELLFRYATEGLVPCAIEVLRVDAAGAEAVVTSGEPVGEAAGLDVKAVTWHQARLAPEAGGWVGQVILDV
jgi:SHS2 domain-containing protein